MSQDAVPDRHAGKPVEIHLHAGLKQLCQTRHDCGKARIIDLSGLGVRLFPRLLVLTLGQNDLFFQSCLVVILPVAFAQNVIERLRALFESIRQKDCVFRNRKAVFLQQRVDDCVARAFPESRVFPLSACKMVQLQMHDLLGDIKALVFLRVIIHQPVVIADTAAVVRDRTEAVAFPELQKRNPLAPLRPAIRQLLTNTTNIHHSVIRPQLLRMRRRSAL